MVSCSRVAANSSSSWGIDVALAIGAVIPGCVISQAMATRANPYGDGTASIQIVQKVLAEMGPAG